jgi:hypothetical protein
MTDHLRLIDEPETSLAEVTTAIWLQEIRTAIDRDGEANSGKLLKPVLEQLHQLLLEQPELQAELLCDYALDALDDLLFDDIDDHEPLHDDFDVFVSTLDGTTTLQPKTRPTTPA